jgi:hypothetical protein
MTPWPGLPLPPVLVQRASQFKRVDYGSAAWRRLPHPGVLEPRELPEEWVLRQLGDADLDDDDAVVALLEEYGALSAPFFLFNRIPADRWPRMAPLLQPDEPDDWWRHRGDGTVEDARWWLKTAGALAAVWRDASLGLDIAGAWANEGFVGIETTDESWKEFTTSLNVGLHPFRARVEYQAHGLPQVGLYSAACRQIFNLVVRDETARRCQNETCGRTFVHQHGGAQHGQHRTQGVLLYCSPECAHAEASRQYRRRKAAQAKEKKKK